MIVSTRHFLSIAATTFLMAACSAPPQSTEATGETGEAIINGKKSDATQDQVVMIYNDAEGAECTGTLLAPNLVLTARHCVSRLTEESVDCSANAPDIGADDAASSLYIVTGPTFQRKAAGKGAKIFHDDSKTLCNHDIALIVLESKIPNAQIAPIRLASRPKVGETFTAVGWGVTTATAFTSTRQQRAAVAITAVGPSNTPTFGKVDTNEFLVGEAICQGDSGGPALATSTGAVLGVVSRGGNGQPPDQSNPAAGCIGATNLYTEVAGFASLIQKAADAAGAELWIEGGPDPRKSKFAEVCAKNDDCRSGLCDVDAQICTEDCTTYACPDGYDCRAETNLCVAHVDPPVNAEAPSTSGGCAAAPSPVTHDASAFAAILGGVLLARRRRRARI